MSRKQNKSKTSINNHNPLLYQKIRYSDCILAKGIPFGKFAALLLIGLWIATANFSPPCCLAAAKSDDQDLTKLSLEDLMNIEVTSVSKRAQSLGDISAAVYVITGEDIRRAGVTNIADALRMVPGVQVARVDSNKWAVTARGFNGRFANKLLVLMDGRNVYSHFFSGVFWDLQDTMLEDIDRIEVIRGPGASVWGANAVNGVINIITKDAAKSKGILFSGGAGDEEKKFGSARYGGAIGDKAHFRMYAKYFDRDSSLTTSGNSMEDDWDALRGGFRTDWRPADSGHLTFQGDIYDGDAKKRMSGTGYSPNPPYIIQSDKESQLEGGNILCRWSQELSSWSDYEIQAYYDRENSGGILAETFDLDFHNRLKLGDHHEIIWGLGYRRVEDDFDNTFSYSMTPKSLETDLYSGFLQGDFELIRELVRFTLGSKFEHNDYTGNEIQPTARLLITPNEKNSLWASVSKAVRTPSRGESDAQVISSAILPNALFPGSPLIFVRVNGSDDFDSEEVIAYEAGYRTKPFENMSLDLALFYNKYDKLRTVEPINQFNFVADNKMKGETYGLELAADYKPLEWMRFKLAYTYLNMHLDLYSDSRDTQSESAEDESPNNQISLLTSLEIPMNIEMDIWLKYVDNLPASEIHSYTALDIRLGWRPHKKVAVSLVGQNLLDGQHPEFKAELLESSKAEIERSFYAMVTLNF